MGFGGATPPKVNMPPPAAHPPTLGSVSVSATQATNKAASQAEGQGFDDTISTSPQGLKAPSTAKTTLLGG